MKRGFVYLFAVLDWASRRVLAWRLSHTLAQQGLARYLTFYNQTRPRRALDGAYSEWSVC